MRKAKPSRSDKRLSEGAPLPSGKKKLTGIPSSLDLASAGLAKEKQLLEGTPVVPRSIEDVARLFMGPHSVENVTDKGSGEDAGCSVKKKGLSPKRPRDDQTAAPSKESRRKKQKKIDPAILPSSSQRSNTLGKGSSKSRRAVPPPEEDPDDEGEDVELTRAVQAQTLRFLRHLGTAGNKAFWGFRDVAQGKRSASEVASSLSPSSPQGRHTTGKTNNASAQISRTEELRRVGRSSLPVKTDPDEDGESLMETISDDGASQGSDSSSEPSVLTDSSDNDGGSERTRSSRGSGDDSDEDEVTATHSPSKPGGHPASTSSHGGGRLFHGADDIWDD